MDKSTANPQIEKPNTKGKTFPLKALAIAIPKGIEIKEERDPITAAPTPAMCPRGSIAKALRFPKRKAIPGKITIMNVMNIHPPLTCSLEVTPRPRTIADAVVSLGNRPVSKDMPGAVSISLPPPITPAASTTIRLPPSLSCASAAMAAKSL